MVEAVTIRKGEIPYSQIWKCLGISVAQECSSRARTSAEALSMQKPMVGVNPYIKY